MALTLQTIFTNNNPTKFQFPPTHFSNSPKFTFPPPNSRSHFPNQNISTRLFAAARITDSFQEPSQQQQPNADGLDALLSLVEFVSLSSSAAVCVYAAVRCGLQLGAALGSRVFAWQCVVLVTGLAAGAAIRRRQWSRMCGVGVSSAPANLLERVEKLEEDSRAAASIVQALARRLEKLGIRFRLNRKALKEPIAETALLVQKNSQATQALAAEGDVLEKELGEIQKVLLSMQEQQRKQLELIIAIGKAGKLWDGAKRVKAQDPKAPEAPINKIETVAWQKESNNDIP
ncbi:hypothetical protein SASPL_143670 [Salvia splendens]|uniref:Uncharacterized protein n=1 Tax=Salvia splendens TaxID=180675 RepID=A0A8X8ZAK1_SALSN|nr:uncharacterized protein LOC121769968 isoform X1 [Salvia splendens]KAG6397502.1 hypothetical protein SASPL_143670 [Salvia splendens]